MLDASLPRFLGFLAGIRRSLLVRKKHKIKKVARPEGEGGEVKASSTFFGSLLLINLYKYNLHVPKG